MLNIRITATDKRKPKLNIAKIRAMHEGLGFDQPAGAGGFGGGAAAGGPASIGGGPASFPGTGGAYGAPGAALAAESGAAGRAAYAAQERLASQGLLTPFGSEMGPGGGPAFPGEPGIPASTFGPGFQLPVPPLSVVKKTAGPTVTNESGQTLPVVGAGSLLRPGFKVHHLGAQGAVSTGETVAGVLASTGAIQAASGLSGALKNIGSLGAGLIGYEATKTALEKIATGELPTLPELLGLATFAASLYLLAPEEGLGYVATGLAWLSTIGRGLIKAGEVAAATEAVDIGERIVSAVGQESGRLLQQQSQQPLASPTPQPVAAVPAVQTIQRELAAPGPSVPLPPTAQQIAAEQRATQLVAQQAEPSQVPPGAVVTQPVAVSGQPIQALTPEQTIAQQTQEIQRLMQQQRAAQPQAVPLETGQPQMQPLEALSGQPGGVPPPAPGPKPLPFEHQPGGCYSPQQMEELVSCPNFQKALTEHFHIEHQPGQRPMLTPKQSVCICCDSAQDMRDYVDSGGVRGACMQVEGLQNIHPKLGGG